MWIMTSYVDNYFIEASKVSDIFTYTYIVLASVYILALIVLYLLPCVFLGLFTFA